MANTNLSPRFVPRVASSASIRRTQNEVFCYSQVNSRQIVFDKSQIHSFRLPSPTGPGWDVRKGYRQFRPKVFMPEESRIRNLLLTTVQYESENKGVQKPLLLCHTGFLDDIITDSSEDYDVIWYHNQLVASSRNRRVGQQLLSSFVGIRFEDLLESGDPSIQTMHNQCHFKTLQRGDIGGKDKGFSYLSVTEIDSCQSPDKSADGYTEIKLSICRPPSWEGVENLDSAAFLAFMAHGTSNFSKKLLKWVVQCEYGPSPYLVVGLRDDAYHVRVVRQLNVKEEVVPFMEERYPTQYAKFAGGVDKLVQVVGWMKQRIAELSKDKEGPHVFRFNVLGGNKFDLLEVEDDAQDILDNVLIPEFQRWRERGTGLEGSDWIFSSETSPTPSSRLTYTGSSSFTTHTKKEVFFYSQVGPAKVAFDQSELDTFDLPSKGVLRNKRWNVQNGYEGFSTGDLPDSESLIRNPLLGTIAYEVNNGPSSAEILCRSGFFCDVVNNSSSHYDVIWYHNQFVVACRHRGACQNVLLSYSGVRFEDLLKTHNVSVPTLANYRHFNSVQEGTIGGPEGFKFLAFTEVDSCLSASKRVGSYTEVKLTLLKNVSWDKLLSADADSFLNFLASKWSFGVQLRKWILQCEFGMSSFLLVGLRDVLFNVRAVHLFNVNEELVPFLQHRYPSEYAVYKDAAGKLLRVIGWMKQSVAGLAESRTFRLDIMDGNKFSFYEVKGQEGKDIMDNVLIDEFRQWRETAKNPLPESAFVAETVDEITHDLEHVTI